MPDFGSAGRLGLDAHEMVLRTGYEVLQPKAAYAIIPYMTGIPLADARANLSRLIDEAVRTHQRIEITRNGVRAAVVLSADDYDSLMETLDILADADLVAELHQAQLESNAGELFTLEEVLTELPAERRPARDPGSPW